MTPEQIALLPYRPCVGVMLVNRDGHVFVGQRIDTKEPAWQMPQGGIDPGEDARAAAVRELAEETGVTPDLVRIEAETAGWVRYDLPHDLVARMWKGRYRGQEQKWFLARFRGDDSQINILTAHPEFSHWCWLSPADLPRHIVPFKRAVYTAVLEEFAPHL
ncbi:RNA pyrophosphohydrolase [Roseovarius sp. M141]|uniref:RNA pyrophosphohydrolase n=1 Tax=Roseovarius sp. M141 TaxID=2583806 RepID=UPI0020CDEA21|nr:RNA pyrophosphohydrolase [Roseovarius sp. M141]MCQ0093911.1 RNA pyrophosphohydrolase [Roseovarius sp. M141]